MASKVEEFVSAPCEDLLNDLTKDQLVELAGYYKINLVSQDKRLKDNIISLVKTELIKRGVLESQFSEGALEFVATSTMSPLTFEQQKQLLLIQTEMKEKLLEAQNRVEMSKVQLQQQQLDLERYRLDLIRDGKLPLTGGVERDLASCKSDVVTNMRLIPRFDEKDVERFFLLFERVAEARNWPDEERTLMLQSVFTNKAQEAYSSLSVEDAKDYLTVKNAVLRAYELVPEAYRQKFRSWKKTDSQTHVEFVHDISVYFNRWCTASDVKTLDDLKELMLLERFKNAVSQRVATYIGERKPDTAYEAAVMADEFSLIHKTSFGYKNIGENFQKESGYDPSRSSKFLHSSPDRQRFVFGEKEKVNMCNYCHGFGHWKNECPLLKATSCVITRSMSKIQSDVKSKTKRMGNETLEIPSILSVSRDDLIKEQKADVSLIELFDRVVPYDKIVNLPSGYYLEEDVLVRKWVPHGEFVIGDPVLQIVVPQSLRQLVLQTAHDASGHLGVKKTYKLLLKRFFWPKLKRDISKYIKSCQTCQLTGKPNQSLFGFVLICS